MHPHQNLTDALASVALVWIRPCVERHVDRDVATSKQAVAELTAHGQETCPHVTATWYNARDV